MFPQESAVLFIHLLSFTPFVDRNVSIRGLRSTEWILLRVSSLSNISTVVPNYA